MNRVVGYGVALWLMLIGGGYASAAKLYKYQDEKGKWHFTDKKPKQQTQYSQEQLVVTEGKDKFSVVNRGSERRPILYAVNKYHGPVQVSIHLTRSQNIETSHKLPLKEIIAGNSEQLLVQIGPKRQDQSWHYRYKTNVVLGEPRAHLRDFAYGVPFEGGPYYITQGFGGEASHNDSAQSYHAIDVALPVGTPIIAVRAGVVMETDVDYSRAGFDMKYMDEANLVRVLHDDGGMALYAHLDTESVLVKPGDLVQQGQRLGFSGNTGFSSGPHLHFVIQKNDGRELKSSAFKFQINRRLLTPTSAHWLSEASYSPQAPINADKLYGSP